MSRSRIVEDWSPESWTFMRRLRFLIAEILMYGFRRDPFTMWATRKAQHEQYKRGLRFGESPGDFDIHVADAHDEGAGGGTVRLALSHWKPQVIKGGTARPIGFRKPGDGGDAA